MSLAKEKAVVSLTDITEAAKEVVTEDITPVTLKTVIVIVTSQVEEDHAIATIQGIEETEETTRLVNAKTEKDPITKAAIAEGKKVIDLISVGIQAQKSLTVGQGIEEDQIQTKGKKKCGKCTPISKESRHRLKQLRTSMSMEMNFSGTASSG